ncbi:MAG TPA: hypothetical protein VNK41_03070 [Vicinamibacterales bacterium]|nr:hypothetical protein [Vicinamibacterales bacterium]
MTAEHTDRMRADDWLHALRSAPPPVFKAQLRERLRAQEPSTGARSGGTRRVLVAAAAAGVIAVLVSTPAVRASMTQFLSLFRVINVVGVSVDKSRIDQLNAENLQIETLIGEHVQVVHDPGSPVHVDSLGDAAALAGMELATPQWLPNGTKIIETAVMGERVVRVTASGMRLRQVMDALGINDLDVPPGLDGRIVDVRVPPVVMIRYEHGKRRTRLFQARTPELTLPGAIDLEALGEIGLRIVGLPPAEAKQFARAIDWHTTLVVPVPPNATSFRQVHINGRTGVLIQHQPRDQSPTSTIVWSTEDRVFALVSILGVPEATAIALSVR